MTRYQAMFRRLEAENRAALIPFTVIGDPSSTRCIEIVEALIEGGADALELGIPFSDPIADGPTIQAAAQRALEAGTTPTTCWDLIAAVRSKHPDIPIGILTYANLATQNGPDAFYGASARAGVDSVLLADVPTLESLPYVEAAVRQGVDPVLIAPPNATSRQLDVIATQGRGYTYVVTRFGVTGAKDSVRLNHGDLLAQLRARGAAPACLGFGIANAAAVRDTVAAGAAGAICGSAIVKRIQQLAFEDSLEGISAFVRELRAATLKDSS